MGRGAAFLDYNNDSELDVIAADKGDPLPLLHNIGGTGYYFVSFRLAGPEATAPC